MKIIKSLKIWAIVLLVAGQGYGQSYVKLADATGYSYSTQEIENITRQIIDLLPIEFKTQFKVYDFGYYLHNEIMTGSNSTPEIWSRTINEISNQSPYYIIYGREVNHLNNFNALRIEMKLPDSGVFSCLSESDKTILHNGVAVMPKLSLLLTTQQTGYNFAIQSAISSSLKYLRDNLIKINECCQGGIWSSDCGSCRYNIGELEGLFVAKGFSKLTEIENISISSGIYSAIQSSKQISFSFRGSQIEFTHQLETFAIENGAIIRITEFNDANCDSVRFFNPLVGTGDYFEDIIILEMNGKTTILSKITGAVIDNDLIKGNGSRALPIIVYEVLRRLAMAGMNVLIDLGIEIAITYWVGDCQSFEEAWEQTEISPGQILSSAANGAIADRKVSGLIADALQPVGKWIIDTPAKDLSWEEFGQKIIEGLKDVVLQKVVGNFISSYRKKAKKFSSLDNETFAIFQSDQAELFASNYLLATKSQKKIEEVYKLFNRNSPLKKDGKYLEKVMNAMAPPDKYKIKGQKLGYGKNSTVLGENIKKHRGGNYTKCQNCESHHIVPGGKGGPGTDLDKLRNKMKDLGVDINEGVQGVDLPKELHNKTKYDRYDTMLYNLLNDKNTADEFREALEDIGKHLKNGKGPDGKPWGW